jgi:hypothetical protein
MLLSHADLENEALVFGQVLSPAIEPPPMLYNM